MLSDGYVSMRKQKFIYQLSCTIFEIKKSKWQTGGLNRANELFFVSFWRADDVKIKMSPKQSPVVGDGYMKYEEAEIDRLVAILKTNNCDGGVGGLV